MSHQMFAAKVAQPVESPLLIGDEHVDSTPSFSPVATTETTQNVGVRVEASFTS